MAIDFRSCKVCKDHGASTGMVKYAVRHYAHFDCYLKSGHSLEKLTDFQIGQFPYRVLEKHGQLEYAQKRLDEGKK